MKSVVGESILLALCYSIRAILSCRIITRNRTSFTQRQSDSGNWNRQTDNKRNNPLLQRTAVHFIFCWSSICWAHAHQTFRYIPEYFVTPFHQSNGSRYISLLFTLRPPLTLSLFAISVSAYSLLITLALPKTRRKDEKPWNGEGEERRVQSIGTPFGLSSTLSSLYSEHSNAVSSSFSHLNFISVIIV